LFINDMCSQPTGWSVPLKPLYVQVQRCFSRLQWGTKLVWRHDKSTLTQNSGLKKQFNCNTYTVKKVFAIFKVGETPVKIQITTSTGAHQNNAPLPNCQQYRSDSRDTVTIFVTWHSNHFLLQLSDDDQLWWSTLRN